MKSILVFIIFCLGVSHLKAQPFRLDTLLYNGTSEKRINYVILGDGYLNTQLATFRNDAAKVVANLFSVSPFKEYKNYFNVFAISVPSNVEGAATGPQSLIDNYFGSTFNYAGIQRLLVPTKNDRVANVLAQTFPTYDQIMMIVNSTEYGGSGGWISTSSVNVQASEIAIHELGHSFAALSDEYWAGPQYAAETSNMTQQSSTSLVKWKNWLNDFDIGIIPHVGNPTWFKPHPNCKMQSLGNDFCAVCKEQFIVKIHGMTSPVDHHASVAESETVNFNLDLVKPDPNTLNVQWFFNGTKVGQNDETTNIKLQDLVSGTNRVEAIIFDSTKLDRKNTVYITTIRWTMYNSVLSSSVEERVGDRNVQPIITDVKSETSRMSLSVFPNPSHRTLTIAYELTTPSPIELSILNSEGKKIRQIINETQLYGSYSYEIDVSNYPDGLYIIDFTSRTIHQSHRIIKSD